MKVPTVSEHAGPSADAHAAEVPGVMSKPPNPLALPGDDALSIEADTVATVQEKHLVLVHGLCTALEAALERE
ncbi:hypothetical protein [Nocardia sputorum]|uniref:Uncharacterized protein n=1 Tax=Nocardia sputorum TaxID=2984338 RepID=A0ABM8CUJ0_9NOCA|nr:hypothetical protein [Nocardia sputorum]BDT96881.1 hypothetical protein IFM12275_68570 [Nocardia sputorum]BDT98631.1 hypothetical protein IFM12276_16600 [Nocardia sputorum]